MPARNSQQPERINIHATGLNIRGLGVLIRGPSGAGKSLLALDLLDWTKTQGALALLVGDDRLDLSHENNVLYMRAPKNLSGKIELRGCGIVLRDTMPVSKVDLIVDLVAQSERMPDQDQFITSPLGVQVDRCPVPNRDLTDGVHQRLLVLEALTRCQTKMAKTVKST